MTDIEDFIITQRGAMIAAADWLARDAATYAASVFGKEVGLKYLQARALYVVAQNVQIGAYSQPAYPCVVEVRDGCAVVQLRSNGRRYLDRLDGKTIIRKMDKADFAFASSYDKHAWADVTDEWNGWNTTGNILAGEL